MARRREFNPNAIIRFTYDPDANAAYVYLAKISPGAKKGHGFVDRRIGPILDYDDHDHILGIEILSARENLVPELLDAALRAGGILELVPHVAD